MTITTGRIECENPGCGAPGVLTTIKGEDGVGVAMRAPPGWYWACGDDGDPEKLEVYYFCSSPCAVAALRAMGKLR